MYVEKYSLNTNFHKKINWKKKCKTKIIDFMSRNKEKFLEESIPSNYIILNLKEPEEYIYQSLHELLDDNIIEKKYFSVCPYCYTENITSIHATVVKCLFCGESHIKHEVEERYSLRES